MIDRKAFFDAVRASPFAGHMTEGQVSGIEQILLEWDTAKPASDLRFLAYALGTAFHETARTMQPIAEYGHGKGRAYGSPTGAFKQIYYGRGYVQLTWIYNYEKADGELHKRGLLSPSENLMRSPELALRPDVAACIMFCGMVGGWFTGRKLADYFTPAQSDWLNARRIINGTDKADLVAGYGKAFFLALQKAWSPDPYVHPAPSSAPAQIPVAGAGEALKAVAVVLVPAAPSPSLWARFKDFWFGWG